MELGVVAAVLGAAFLHALWNFMVRRADDKALGGAESEAQRFGRAKAALALPWELLLRPRLGTSRIAGWGANSCDSSWS